LSGEVKTAGVGSAEPQLPVVRFGLKQFLWWVTGACLLMAGMAISARSGSMSPLVLLMAVLAVGLHIGGTAIGMRLKAHANERRAWEAGRIPGEAINDGPPPMASKALPRQPQTRSPLHGHDRPLRRLRSCVIAGAVLGGGLGVAALWLTIGDRTSAAGIVVGALSTAIVGAWLAFVAANSWAIFRQGWLDAVNAGAPDQGRE
jgi:hypothetical protein